MSVSIIVATSANNVIGKNGGLPWHLSDDLKRFKAITMGKPIVMGRLTYESIGRPLPGRQNIVITRQADFRAESCDVVSCPADALRAAGDAEEIMVIGGGYVYRQFFRRCNRIYLTRVHVSVDGDVFFPEIDPGEWDVVEAEEFAAGPGRELGYRFQVMERKPAG